MARYSALKYRGFKSCAAIQRFSAKILTFSIKILTPSVVGEVMKERRRRERERLINLSTCGCVIQLYLWENTQFIEIREFGWGFLMLTS